MSKVGAVKPRDIYSVSRLNEAVRDVLEESFPPLWVEGELSNLARPASGHMYFSLKDSNCQVRCAMFRRANYGLRFAPENGMRVLVHARVGLYPQRGEFQLVVDFMEEAGEGALRRAFEALKQRLAAEGLFDEDRKRLLPTVPRQIGVVTSPTGAAIRDILSVLARRFPSIPVIIYPTSVQGENSADEIVGALALATERAECDVLILARGGGSLEDLWSFNEERVARAIAACPIPVVAGVGHEVDFTIADFVADRRAPTPSAAAELVTPDREELAATVAGLWGRLRRRFDERLRTRRQQLAALNRHLAHMHPRRRLEDHIQGLDSCTLRLARAMRHHLQQRRDRMAVLDARLAGVEPGAGLRANRQTLADLDRRLASAVNEGLRARAAEVERFTHALALVSPLHTLARGYAIVTAADSTRVIRAAGEVHSGDKVKALLGKGSFRGTVDSTDDG